MNSKILFLETLSALYDICPKCEKYTKGQLFCNKCSANEQIKKGCFEYQILLELIVEEKFKSK